MTLEERAKIATAEKHEGNIVTIITAQGAYIKGATEQKQIDDIEMSDALFIQRQMFFEKACEALYTLMDSGCCDIHDINKAKEIMKKAMEE